MPVTVIPFKMPEPLEIPAHIVAQLEEMGGDKAVVYGMQLLLQIDAAEVVAYERIDEQGQVGLAEVVAQNEEQGQQLKALLEKESCYGQPFSEGHSLSGQAFAQQSPLLIMGQAESGEEVPLPAALKTYLFDGGDSGNVGFMYVLPFSSEEGRALGAMTLMRSAPNGPLNHEQPNIAEALRQALSRILAG